VRPLSIDRCDDATVRAWIVIIAALRPSAGAGADPAARAAARADVPDGPSLAGIDVSKYQGEIDWPTVKTAGIEFAFIRASHGTEEDRYSRSTGPVRTTRSRVRGAYQFFRAVADRSRRPTSCSASSGALAPGDLPPVIDVEGARRPPPAEVAAAVRAWLDRVASATGRHPVIYTWLYFRDPSASIDELAAVVARAVHRRAVPEDRAAVTDWRSGSIRRRAGSPGITGPVDLGSLAGRSASSLLIRGAARRRRPQ
jgi:lysozyme